MSARIRRTKNASVYENLKAAHSYRSDQGAVWDEIARQARMNKVTPATGAMKDVLEARQKDLNAFLEHFPATAGQDGLVVLVNGQVVGLDRVSREAAFRILHPKLIRSYVMDALIEKPARAKEPSIEQADALLNEIFQCAERIFDSVGYGRDYRYEGEKIVGSALVHEETLIHTAFFRTDETKKSGRMSSVSRRRAFRADPS